MGCENTKTSSLRRGVLRVIAICWFGLSLTACTQLTQYVPPQTARLPGIHEPRYFLQHYVDFSEEDLTAMDNDEVVAKVFDQPTVENEVGAFGIVRLNISKSLFVERVRQITTLFDSPMIQANSRFSDPPCLADVQDLTLAPEAIEALATCQPGSCKVKLDTRMMERFQREVDWTAPDYHKQATHLMRELLVEHVTRYLQEGDAALGVYHDQPAPLPVQQSFRGLFQQAFYLQDYVPEFYAYLQNFPAGRLPNVENFVYWTIEQYGLRPVINVFHISIYTRRRQRSTEVFVSSKRIYASHYFEASLSISAFVNETGGAADASNSYLMYLNRSRFDNLRGAIKQMIMPLAKERVYQSVKHYFRQIKNRLEASR